MKKLTLKSVKIGTAEVLTRTQLRNVLGGDGSGSGDGSSKVGYTCICEDGRTFGITGADFQTAIEEAQLICSPGSLSVCNPG